ncbi:MAG: 50S ribosomal protein L32 [Chloroflexi bacterium]|nr:MAG: 50S ribosomal protein L32 [Chloroflexota bacterium]
MAPLPKRRVSRTRRNKRRTHDSLMAVHLVDCPQCHSPRLPHHVCPHCGFYRGVEVVAVEEEAAAE